MLSLYFKIILASSVVFSLGCVSAKKQGQMNNLAFDGISELLEGRGDKKRVLEKMGPPREKGEERWVYYKAGAPKVWLFFENDKLAHVTYSVWKNEEYKKPDSFLKKINGAWTVITEPWTNPHSGPHLCYVEDLKAGRRVKVNAYKKSVSEISIWHPTKKDKSIKEYLYSKVGKEYCLGGSCSKVSDSGAWDPDHCKWLKDTIRKQK